MTKWVDKPPTICTGILISFLLTLTSKIEVCHLSIHKPETYSLSYHPSYNHIPPKQNSYLNKSILNSHYSFRRRSLKKLITSLRKSNGEDYTWPVKRVAEIEGDVILGGLMMIHEREDSRICGPIMPQGGIQALECMLYTVDWINNRNFLPGIKLGCYVLDDCDKDTYGLEQAVDFIKGKAFFFLIKNESFNLLE